MAKLHEDARRNKPDYWYEDSDINKLLTTQLGDRAVIVPAISNSQEFIHSALANTLLEITPKKPAVIPINLGENHWASMVVHRNEDDNLVVFFNDSLGSPINLSKSSESGKYIAAINELSNTTAVVMDLQMRQQSDGVSCGPFTTENLVALASLKPNQLTEVAAKEKINSVEKDPLRIRQSHGDFAKPLVQIETFGKESSWKKKGEKEGGARGAGEYGGIYTNGKKTALIKQDSHSPNFDIAEYMSSKIFAAVSPNTGAVVEMMVPEGQEKGIPGDGSNVYVRSEFFDNYSDMFKDMDKHMPEKDKPSKLFRKDGRPLLMGTRQKFSKVISKAIDGLGYQGFSKIAPGSLLVGDFDMHTGNIGVIREPGKDPQLKRIDFGWGFANLTRDVHPHSISKHIPGQGPTNHFREFPRRYKLTEEFVEGLNQSANADIASVLDKSFDELNKYYNKPVLQKWAQHAMPKEFGKQNVDEINLDQVKSTLKDVMQARQASLKEFAIEIKLGLIAEPTSKKFKKKYTIDRVELKKLVKENPDYFEKISNGTKKIRLRDKKLEKSNTYKKLLKQEIIAVRAEIAVEKNTPEQFQSDVSSVLQEKLGRNLNRDELEQVQYLAHDLEHVNDGQAMASLDKGLQSILNVTELEAADLDSVIELVANYHKKEPEKAKVTSALEDFNAAHEHDGRTEEQTVVRAKDSAMFIDDSVVSPTLPSSGVASESSEIDPITEAIRREILTKQQKLLQEEIATSDPSVTAMDAEKFREYLISEKGKEESAKVFAKPAMQTALNKIEVEGYKEVHNKFQENFQNVAWAAEASSPDQPKTKSCEIKNEAGQVVANIKETTHDKAPIAVTLENGEKVTVKSFRTIEFPVDNKGKGPLHLSMAVKDENGKNIAEKDAVYFTAHYDEKGKLTEVSSPVPVKFMGKGDDAVGYIERNGKVYTLPVTQGKYKEMMKEVAKNKGMGVNLSQEVEKPAEDLAVTKSKTVEPVLEKEEVVKKPAVKEQSIDSIEVVEQEPVPLKIVLPSGLTGGEKTQAVDTALKDATPEQIVATLKNEVSKGGSEIVGLIVESTKPDRTGDHPNVPKLTAEQFKEVYDVGMKSAKAKVDAPANQKTKFMQGLKLNGIHAACAKLAPSAKVDAQSHKQASSTNLSKFNGKHAQISR